MLQQAYGGYTVVAAELTRRFKHNKQGKPFSRQQVWTWYTRRVTNGFPDYYEFVVDHKPSCPPDCTGHAVRLFRLVEVVDWYVGYVPSHGGRPKRKQEEERDGSEGISRAGDRSGD